jgi:hypothetical protein
MAGVRRVPFELVKLNEGLRKGETTFIVEGPRKCGPLHEWELTATCNMGGSGAAAIWREHAKEFFLPVYNSPVVILPDNDAPGAKSAAIIADALASVGVTVSFLELPVGPKGDIINWIDGGGTRQQFVDLVKTEARAWEPGERIEANLEAFAKAGAQCKEQRAPTFPLIGWRDIAFNLIAEWLLKRLLPRKGVAVFYGVSGAMKTFVLLDLLLHIALGWKWAGRAVRQAPVIFIAAEASDGLRKRKVGWEEAHKDSSLPADVPFHLIEVAPNLGTGTGDCKKLIADIEAAGARPGVIAIDTVAQAIGGADENNIGMATFISNAASIASHFDCLVCAVHHCPLSDDRRPRGWSGLGCNVEALLLLERTEGKLSSIMEVMKLKEEESHQKFTVHFSRVTIGKDEDGEDVTTLFVSSVDQGAAETAKQDKRKAAEILRDEFIAVYDRLADGAPKTLGLDLKTNVIKISVDKLRDELKDCGFLDTDGNGNVTPTSRSQFQRVKAVLCKTKGGKFSQKVGFIWRR